jgi:hypothetical protein
MGSPWLILPLAFMLACGTAPSSRAQAQPTPATPTTLGTPPPPPPPARPPARRIDPDPGEVAVDVLVVRPIGIAATAVGAAIFVVALPFAAIAGDVDKAARTLVNKPARFTFRRPLGDFDHVDY